MFSLKRIRRGKNTYRNYRQIIIGTNKYKEQRRQIVMRNKRIDDTHSSELEITSGSVETSNSQKTLGNQM